MDNFTESYDKFLNALSNFYDDFEKFVIKILEATEDFVSDFSKALQMVSINIRIKKMKTNKANIFYIRYKKNGFQYSEKIILNSAKYRIIQPKRGRGNQRGHKIRRSL